MQNATGSGERLRAEKAIRFATTLLDSACRGAFTNGVIAVRLRVGPLVMIAPLAATNECEFGR
jgi:hypothetical protein